MTSPDKTPPTLSMPSQEVMLSRYQNAQSLLHGIFSNKIALNATVFPIWIDHSDCFWYERESREGKEYRLVDAKARTNDIAFDHGVLAATLAESVTQEVDANKLPINNVSMIINQSTSTVKTIDTIQFTAFNQSWQYDVNSNTCTVVEIKPTDWAISPDGKHAVFTRDFDLWIHDINSGEERALTKDGEEHYVYGVTGSAWGHKMWGPVQACWSPDSKRLLTIQRDTRRVNDLDVMHHLPKDGSLRPTIAKHKISYPGDEHVETLRLLSIDVESGRLQEANYKQIPTTRNSWGFFSSNMGWWSTDSNRAYFVDMERDYKAVRVIEFNTSTGVTKVIIEEITGTHINLMLNSDELPYFKPLPESNELLWFSERSGWAHLYLYDLDTGQLKNAVTQGDWLVRYVISVDTIRREAFIQTAGRFPDRDPYYRDLCRVHLDTGKLTTVISSDHEITAIGQSQLMKIFAMSVYDIADSYSVSPSGNFAVITRSRADSIPSSILLDRDGQECLHLETADVSALPEGWQWPEPVKLLAADGKTDIYGLVFRPSHFSPNQNYPVVSHVFNTPELTWVSKGSFSSDSNFGWPYHDAAALAELGFIVVQIDGRGTPYRHKAFHDENYGWAESSSNLDDHAAGIRQLAQRYPYMDINRVGITTHPSGGVGGIQGLLQHGDLYTVGVALGPHDSRLMPAVMWGDKYEGLAGPDADHLYPEKLVDNLKGKLLLMQGMLDTTNPPAGVFRIIDALEKANKDFDLVILPKLGHAPSDYLYRRAWDYLVRHLLNIEPPKEFKLTISASGV